MLLLNDHKDLVEQGQEVDPLAEDVVSSLGQFKKSPNLRASCRIICEYIFFFPTNLIPISQFGLTVELCLLEGC